MDRNIVIQDTGFTVGNILKSLEENCPEFQELVKTEVQVIDFSSMTVSDNKGHGSIVRKLTFDLSSGDKFSVALKIPTAAFFIKVAQEQNADVNAMIEPMEKFISRLHTGECIFFNNVAGLFETIPIPKVYKVQEWVPGQQQGCILMEDLGKRGVVKEKGEALGKEQVWNVVRSLAEFHVRAWEIEGAWKDKYLDGQNIWADISIMYPKIIEEVEGLIEEYYEEETVAKLKSYINYFNPVFINREFHIWAYRDAHVECNVKPVICHGDLWLCNLFWKKESPNELHSFIDWQLFHEGSPAVDLARFLILNFRGPLRKEIEETVFDHYIDCIKSELKGKEVPFTVEQLKKCYNAVFSTQVLAFLSLFRIAITEQTVSKDILMEMVEYLFEDSYKLLTGELEAVKNKFSQVPDIKP
ncbi:hypothetical protein FO519_001822 [Halicephalobus sp. NKZ332]|nr:hypothetical protein FO519_001822 [Halicephalobus sp. NKZ332]